MVSQMPKQSQDVQTPAGNGTVSGPSPFQRLRRRMAEMAVLDTAEKKVSGEDINAILLAETEADMWDADEMSVYNAQKLSGTDLQIISFEVRFSDGSNEDIKTPFVDDKGRQMYLLVQAFRITEARGEDKTLILPEVGTEFVWNTSARNIVAKLFWMLDHGWFDIDAPNPVRVHMKGTGLTGGRSVEKMKQFTGTPLVTTSVVTGELPF
jgi:hypothetical protein